MLVGRERLEKPGVVSQHKKIMTKNKEKSKRDTKESKKKSKKRSKTEQGRRE